MTPMPLHPILPIPEYPSYRGSDSQWKVVQRILGISLPRDYVEMIDQYGAGIINDFLVTLSPFAPWKSNINLLTGFTPTILSSYADGRRDYPEFAPPFASYPSNEGVFPWATTVNGDALFWLTKGPPDDWPIVVCDSKCSEDYDVYDCRASEFICRWLRGEVKPSAFPIEFPLGAPSILSFSDKSMRRE